MTYYEPTEEDIAWAKQVVGCLNDGGTWLYPSAQMIFRVGHEKKLIELVSLCDDGPNEVLGQWLVLQRREFDCTVAVFGKIGYRVTDPQLLLHVPSMN